VGIVTATEGTGVVRIILMSVVSILLVSGAALARPDLKTCSANRSYCSAAAKKHGWTRPQCTEAFERCMRTGQWQTSGQYGRTVRNVERR
jgi:hypothetical protein